MIGRALAALLACVALASGCSSSSKAGGASTTPSSPSSTPSTVAVPVDSQAVPANPGTTGAATSTVPGPAASADDTAAITTAFTTFFDGINPDVDGKVAVLEHGDQLRQMIVDASADAQFQQLSTTVNSVQLQTADQCAAAGEVSPCAAVGHDMFVGGLPAMVGLTSHAVEIDGAWKVSAKSWCAIVQIGGATCPPLEGP